MGFINVAERTINAKLVYYGVGVGGKTTSLQQVHGILCPRNEVQLVSINTEEDSTLLFDFLPINLGSVGGFKIRIQGFTVPGQPKYRQMRKYVLQGADAVVFVVDSQRSRLQENLESLQSMRENLRTGRGTSEDIPIVVQYNKRDLADVLSESELDQHFRFRDSIEAYPSVATEGQGVFEAFVQAVAQLVESKVALYGLEKDGPRAHEVAEGVRQKLYAIHDEVRRGREAVPTEQQPKTRLAVTDDGIEDRSGGLDRSAIAPSQVAAAGPPAATDDEFDLAYQLRDSVARRAARPEPANGEVLTDADLEIDLSLPALDLSQPAGPTTEVDDSLLDKTVQSNLELVKRYGVLDEQRLLLERKVQELVEAAQQTVHDLNRPISAIRLMLSTLRKGYLGKLDEPVNQALDNGLQAVRQMERLMRDLLDSSRLDHDGMQLEFRECDLTLLVGEVLQTMRYELDEYDVVVKVEPLPVAKVDAWAFTKVLLNLLGNAVHYGSPQRRTEIRVACRDEGAQWRLSIADNGIGIPVADRNRLFRRFERGSNTGGISGTGLGLHIVKEIVQGHGGQVTFESTEGVGTTFHLHLPKEPVLAPHSATASTAVGLGV